MLGMWWVARVVIRLMKIFHFILMSSLFMLYLHRKKISLLVIEDRKNVDRLEYSKIMQPTYTFINIWPLFTNKWLLKCLIFYINLSNSIELNTQTKDIFQHTVSLNKYSLCQWSDNSIWQLSYWGFSLLLISWRNNIYIDIKLNY